MKLSWKTGVALVIGGLVLGGVMSSFAADRSGGSRRGGDVRRAHFMMGPIVRGELLVEGEKEGTFKTIKDDAGGLTAIDGNTLMIKEADGQIVQVVVDGDTKYNRDGDDATLSDLKVGDHVFAHREKEGDAAFKTEHVGALSPEEYKKMEARRAACRKDPSSCPRPPHGPGRGDHARWGPGPMGDVRPAPAPAMLEDGSDA
jgi:hypothetical protein